MALENKFPHFFGGIYSGKIQIFRFSIALLEKNGGFLLGAHESWHNDLETHRISVYQFTSTTLFGGG